MTRILTIGLAFISLFSGCASVSQRLIPSQEWSDAATRQQAFAQMKKTLDASFPDSGTMLHRVVLTVAGRQFVLTGQLTISKNNLRLLVMGPMGVLADLTAASDGQVNVGEHNPEFKESWVKNFIAKDMMYLFSVPPQEKLHAGLLEDGTKYLEYYEPKSKNTFRYFFGKSGRVWKSLSVYRKGKRFFQATCNRTKLFDGCRHPLPCSFRVDAKRHQLDVNVVSFAP